MTTAVLYSTDGTVREVSPHGDTWAFDELQSIVGGRFEVLPTDDGRFLVTNEAAKVQNPPLDINVKATMIYARGDRDYIAGPALVVGSRSELDEASA